MITVVIACGGRSYTDRQAVEKAMTLLLQREVARGHRLEVIEGTCAGADTLAGCWASAMGLPRHRFPADWKAHGRRAGFLRNSEMLRALLARRAEGATVGVVGFPGGRGTHMMMRLAREAGVPVWRPYGDAGVEAEQRLYD